MINMNSKIVWLLVHVDDLIFIGNCQETMNTVIRLLCHKFWCRDLSDLQFFLGMEANCDK